MDTGKTLYYRVGYPLLDEPLWLFILKIFISWEPNQWVETFFSTKHYALRQVVSVLRYCLSCCYNLLYYIPVKDFGGWCKGSEVVFSIENTIDFQKIHCFIIRFWKAWEFCTFSCFFITPEGGFSPPDRALGPWFKTTGLQPYSLSVGGLVRQLLCHQLSSGGC